MKFVKSWVSWNGRESVLFLNERDLGEQYNHYLMNRRLTLMQSIIVCDYDHYSNPTTQ